MSQDGDSAAVEMAENANVADAGEPQGLSQEGAPQAESADAGETPSAEDLDARNEAFARPRKPMGPVESNPETVPGQPGEAEQPGQA